MKSLNQAKATCEACRPTIEWLAAMSEIHPQIKPEVMDLQLKHQWLMAMAEAGQAAKDAIEQAEQQRNA
jgi:hypothetical protein